MDGHCCALSSTAWAQANFSHAALRDPRRSRRLVALAAAICENPHMSLPKLLPDWADLQAAYRFLSNDAVAPEEIIAPHLALTRQAASAAPVVLAVQDDTSLDFTCRTGIAGLGHIGDGHGRGLLQHTTLAVLPDDAPAHGRQVLGILQLAYHTPQPAPKGETRRQRQARWNIRDVWQDAARAIGPWSGGRLLHVGDRHADLFRFFDTCRSCGHGFVVRAMHDRWVDDDTAHLWEKLAGQKSWGVLAVRVGTQRNKGNQVQRPGREATLTIRSVEVVIPPSRNDPRTQDAAPLTLWAIYLREEASPAGAEAIEWMLLSSEPVTDLEAARRIIGYYTCRWTIEEFHRCLKEGCRIEQSQLDTAEDLMRLGAILSPLAVRLLALRDACAAAETDAAADTPARLRETVPPLFIRLAAALAQADEATFTLRQFLLTVARRGGYLGRKHDGPPGWKVLWRGWSDLVQMAQGAALLADLQHGGQNCV